MLYNESFIDKIEGLPPKTFLFNLYACLFVGKILRVITENSSREKILDTF